MRIVFACQRCDAVPEPIADINLVVVRHGPGCEVLIAQTKARWPGEPTRLPDTRQLNYRSSSGPRLGDGTKRCIYTSLSSLG
ncbi:MAG TPA: hypothetical protein VG327_16060 [Mycobacterium sp.]|nr:hypothetical protein [Mycobacterium sp.]